LEARVVLVYLELMEPVGYQDQLVKLVQLVHPAAMVSQEQQGLLELEVLVVLRDPLVPMGKQELWDSKGLLVVREVLDQRDRQAQEVLQVQ